MTALVIPFPTKVQWCAEFRVGRDSYTWEITARDRIEAELYLSIRLFKERGCVKPTHVRIYRA